MGRASDLELVIAQGQAVQYLFYSEGGVAAGLTDVGLRTLVTTATNPFDIFIYEMPFDFEVIAIWGRLSAAATAGTLTISPFIAGVRQTDPELIIEIEDALSDRAPRGGTLGGIGSGLQAGVTTSADWNGTSSDLLVGIICLLHLEGI